MERVLSWYNGEPWIKGTTAYKNMQFVHKSHSKLRKKLCQLDNEEIDSATKISKPLCPDLELFLKDFTMCCPFEKVEQRPYVLLNSSSYKPKPMNNMDMAFTQCIFMGLIVLYPENCGIHDATDEDLEAFCHMWRCYGYLLGIADE